VGVPVCVRLRRVPLFWFDPRQVWVDEPIGRHATHRQRMAVVAEGRSARSRVAPLAYNSKLSLCRVAIETGRTHQIRVHLAHLRYARPLGASTTETEAERKRKQACALLPASFSGSACMPPKSLPFFGV